MYKRIVEVVLFTFLVNLISSPLQAAPVSVPVFSSAAQPRPSEDMIKRATMLAWEIAAIGEEGQQKAAPAPDRVPKELFPKLRKLTWKSYGFNPLIIPELLPTCFGKGDDECDIQTFRDVVNGVKGEADITDEQLRMRSFLFWMGADHVFFQEMDGQVPDWFKTRFRAIVNAGKFEKHKIEKGYTFTPCGMAFSTPTDSGKWKREVQLGGNAEVNFDDPIEVWVMDGIYMESGPYKGWYLPPTIPTRCFNLTCKVDDYTWAESVTAAAKEEYVNVAVTNVFP
ncbi:MAG: hypothetical protein KW793_04235, partial [Candidatus Doudnabacteria bacterium]|nr:hypothetical protein [Candidatus Doudnabacteria bacterium]